MDRHRLPLPARPESVGQARHWLAELLDASGLVHQVDTATLLLSELVTNALQHSSGPYEVLVQIDGTTTRVSVTDSANGRPRAATALPAPLVDTAGPNAEQVPAEHGRGLYLVRALSDGWGWQGTAQGKRVWFRLDG